MYKHLTHCMLRKLIVGQRRIHEEKCSTQSCMAITVARLVLQTNYSPDALTKFCPPDVSVLIKKHQTEETSIPDHEIYSVMMENLVRILPRLVIKRMGALYDCAFTHVTPQMQTHCTRTPGWQEREMLPKLRHGGLRFLPRTRYKAITERQSVIYMELYIHGMCVRMYVYETETETDTETAIVACMHYFRLREKRFTFKRQTAKVCYMCKCFCMLSSIAPMIPCT